MEKDASRFSMDRVKDATQGSLSSVISIVHIRQKVRERIARERMDALGDLVHDSGVAEL